MYILVAGSVVNITLNWFLIQFYGIIGAALATTITAFVIMIPILWKTYKITEVKLPFMSFAKITLASVIMGLGIYLTASNNPWTNHGHYNCPNYICNRLHIFKRV